MFTSTFRSRGLPHPDPLNLHIPRDVNPNTKSSGSYLRHTPAFTLAQCLIRLVERAENAIFIFRGRDLKRDYV